MYGVHETNPMIEGYHNEDIVGTLCWNDRELKNIERLRMVSDYGFPMWDVTYCYGRNQQGEKVKVALPFSQLNRRKWKSEIIEWAKRDNVYAKGLGLFDAVSQLI